MKRLAGLQVLRAFACIMIVVYHFNSQIYGFTFYNFGYCAVTIFFLLSGFLSGYKGLKKNEYCIKDSIEVCKNKVQKFYRLYIITFIIMSPIVILAAIKENEIATASCQAVTYIFMIQSWIPLQSYYFSYNGVGWFLSVMMVLYFFEPLLVKKSLKLSKVYTYALIGGGLLALCVWTLIFRGTRIETGMIYIFPVPRILEFLLGILLGIWYKRKSIKLEKKWLWTILELASILMMYIGLKIHIPIEWAMLVWFIPFAALIIIVFAFGRGWISQLLSNRLIFAIADASFTIYIIHQPIVRYIYLINKYTCKFREIYVYVFSVCMLLIFTWLMEKIKSSKNGIIK